MKTRILLLFATILFIGGCQHEIDLPASSFIKVEGQDLIAPDGSKFFIRGTNLGNWLNPEGYMFGFRNTNSAGRINQAFCEMIGPDFTAEFWKLFKDHYISAEDISFLKTTGINTLRIPFHYKLFTDEDYMGLTVDQDGFGRIDSIVKWCRGTGIYLILDMHDAPGGQTGDNIDDSYGYPWLMESEVSQKLFVDIWAKIAAYYENEPVILGYDLLNEPVAPYFDNLEDLNAKLEPLYIKAVEAIRSVDKNHVILLGGAQWNSNFKVFSDPSFDENMMYTCHRYGGEPTPEAIRGFIDFRDSVNRPMYMGETGHNSDEWMASLVKAMEENNIGWTFWPYKKINGSSFVSFNAPENWNIVIDFVESDRHSYQAIRDARPDQSLTRKAMFDLIDSCKFQNNIINISYISALGLNPGE